ncbi:MAG: RNA polymerase sigma factor [Pseudomonadota bacterium]
MLDTTDDRALAALAAAGDRPAFARLVDRHYDRIFAFSWRLMRTRAEAEDLAQDVCVTLARRIGSYRGEAAFTTWLYRLVLNAARDRARAGAARARAHDGFAEVDALRRGGAEARQREAEWLREAIAGLPEEMRETAVLVLDEGLTHEQAAAVLEVAPSTVSWRLMEMRKTLRRLAETAGGPG